MLKIIVNDTEADLGKLKGIKFKKTSPLFKYDKIIGTYSLPFTLPDSDINNKLFGYPHRLDKNDQSTVKLDCQIWHSGLLFIEGILSVTGTQKNKFSCNVKADSGAISDTVEDKLMKDLDLGPELDYKFHGSFDPSEMDYCIFPVHNPNFNDGTLWEGYTNTYNHESLVNYYGIDGFWGSGHPHIVVSAFPYLSKVIKYMFNALGCSVDYNEFDNDILKYICILGLNHLSEPVFDTGTHIAPTISKVKIEKLLSPQLTIKSFILQLANFFNVVFLYKNNSVRIMKTDDILTDATSYVDYTGKMLDNYKKKIIDKKVGVSLTWEPDSNDETFSGFETIDDAKQFFYTTDVSNTVVIPEAILGDIKIDKLSVPSYAYNRTIWVWDVYIQTFELYYDWNPIFGPQYGWNPDTFFNYYETGKEVEASCQVSPTLMKDYTDSGVSPLFSANIPHIQQPGNSFFRKEELEFNLRFMFYVGMRTTTEFYTFDYPAGDYVNNDESLLLTWHGDNGIVENFWKHTLYHLQNIDHEITTDILLKANEIRDFDFTKKIKLDGKYYLADEMQISLLRNSIAPVSFKLIPVTNYISC